MSVFAISQPISGAFTIQKKITAYYDFARDGAEAVIPLGVCLLFGTMAFIMIPG